MKILEIPVKFQNGDKVYTTKQTKIEMACHICDGLGKIKYNNKDMRCPECMGNGKLTSNKNMHVVCDEPFIISSTKINLRNDVVSVKYKGYCGYNSLNRSEENLFLTKEEAQTRCYDLNRERIHIEVEDIIIEDCFKNTTPSVDKITRKLEYYRVHNKFNKDIVINKNNVLIDGYINYLLCKILNIKTVKAVIE